MKILNETFIEDDFTSTNYFYDLNYYNLDNLYESNSTERNSMSPQNKKISEWNFFSHSSLNFNEINFILSFTLKNLKNNYSTLSLIITTKETNNEIQKYQLIFDSEKGIIFKQLSFKNSQSKIIDFYQTNLRKLFNEKLNVELLHINNLIFISTSDSEGSESIKISHLLKNKISKIEIDVDNSNTILIQEITRKNFIGFTDMFNILKYLIRNSLSDKLSFVEFYAQGHTCEVNGKPRRAIIEYRCDETELHDANIDDVIEEDVCVYKLFVKSRFMCNNFNWKNKLISKTSMNTQCTLGLE